MNIFKKAIKTAKDIDDAISTHTTPSEPPKEEEWIWVEGYKGTERDMSCRGYQYEIGPKYSIADGEEVVECFNGFHLSLNLKDVFNYYPIGEGHRFFKVRALVRTTDYTEYDTRPRHVVGDVVYYDSYPRDKLVAKSIIFLSEITVDEILKGTDVGNLPEQYKQVAIDVDIISAVNNYRKDILIEDGYSEPFALHIVNKTDKFQIAHAIGSQKDVSMDIKVLTILYAE